MGSAAEVALGAEHTDFPRLVVAEMAAALFRHAPSLALSKGISLAILQRAKLGAVVAAAALTFANEF
jgi:hypothetical protein